MRSTVWIGQRAGGGGDRTDAIDETDCKDGNGSAYAAGGMVVGSLRTVD